MAIRRILAPVDFSSIKTSLRPVLKAFFVSLIATLFATGFLFSKPAIHFDAVEHDFGKVPENSIQRYEFVFRNKGTGTLIIEKVSAG